MKKALKIFLYVIGGLLVILIGAIGFLLTPPGKNFVRKQAVSFLHKKLKTEVRVGGLDYSLPKWLELKDVLFLDQQKDTLLAAGTLRVDIAMLKLIGGTVQVNRVNFEHGVAHIYRNAPDTVFNFDYIVKAFASPSPKEEKPVDTSGGLVLDIRELALKDIRFRFDDYTGGSRFALAVNELEAKINKTDINKMDFGLKRFYVNGITASFNIDTSYLPEVIDTAAPGPLPMIAADELDLNKVNFTFQNTVDPFLFNIALGKLLLHPKVIDLNKNHIAFNDLTIDTTNVKIVMGKTSKVKPVEAEDTTAPAAKWRVLANNVRLNNVGFVMDDENKPAQQYGIDYAHLNASNININLEQLYYATDTIAGNLKHLSVKEKSGLDLKELRTVFAYYPQGAYLNNLYVQTPHTVLQDHLSVQYPSLEALSTRMQSMQLKLNLQNSVVGMSDVLIFAPQLRSQDLFKRYGSDHLKLNANVTGFVDALNIARFQLQGLNNTTFVDMSGKLNGLPDANKLNYDLSIKRLQSTKGTVMAFMPPSASQQIDLPNSFNITGRLSGNVKDYNTDLYARTTDGNVLIRGKLYMSPGVGREKYDMVLKTESLNVGKIIRKDSILGRITASISAKGTSFDINRMDAMLRGDIASAGFMGYNYKAITFDGKMKAKEGYVSLNSKDPNLVMNLDAQADLRNKYPALVARLVIDSADLQALKLNKDELRVRATMDVNAPELNPDYPTATIDIDRPTIVMKGTKYYLDSLFIVSKPNADTGNFIVMDADAIQAVIMGKTPLSQLGDIMQAHINRYYAGDTVLKPAKPLPADYNLNLAAIIRDRPLLHVFLPGLIEMDTIGIRANLDPATLTLDVNMPRLQYQSMYLYNGKVAVKGSGNALNYDVTLDKFSQGNLEFLYAKLNGNVMNKVVTANVSVSDSSKNARFALGATYRQSGDTQLISMLPGLKLNYDDWQVSQPNVIALGKDGFYVQNFRISKGGESISINSESPQFSAPLTAAINSFLLFNITEIISKDTLLANGVLNTNLRLQNVMINPEASGTLGVANLSVFGDTIGNLDVTLNKGSANGADARITINGKGNDIAVTGFYYPTAVNGNNFDLNMAVNAINVQSFEGLTKHQIKNTSGYIRGNLKIQGTMAAPKVVGQLKTDNLKTTVAMLGAPFSFPAETIAFTADGIEFKNFRIIDTNGNVGTIDGKIITRDYKDMSLALKVKANRLQVLNSTPKDNKLFYGNLLVSSNLGINGPLSAPDVNGSLTIHDSTKFTVALPEKEVGIQEREGIVEFVNLRDTASLRLLAARDTMPKMAVKRGTQLDLNVGIEKNAEFSVIIDQGTGDFLRVRGEASLNTAVRRDGTIGLTGTYELREGAYELNYNMIKRKFKIQPGSTITFAGDPLEADVNITAIYTANIAPYDLVAKQVDNPEQLNYFKQRLPFEVHLKMSGGLMKPNISFDVLLPEDKSYAVSSDVTSLVQAKLTQVRTNASELNKQVFAVLILNRFVSDNPFESGAGGSSAEFIARQSVSRFIGEQLNKFADQLVQGLELTFDLQSTEDYTTGAKRNRTDLNVAASKRLLNDRLMLTVGNNFELEGQNQNKNENTSLIPGNLAADYQLTKDGRYMVRIYRRNEMEDILQGFVVETGTSFVVTLDYNRFRNLFNRRKRMERAMNNRVKDNTEIKPKGTSN